MQVPKPNFPRRKPKKSQRTRITPSVRKEVLRRSEGKCECCGKSRSYAFQMAHLRSAAQMGSGDEYFNIALLCGPSVNKGTCHWWADSTREGREWRENKRKELIEYYEQQNR